jgi:D-arginine utilization repressor
MIHRDPFAAHRPTAAAISALLHPHAEVVLHDLATRRIAGIWNGISGRRIGDDSLLDDQPGGDGEGPIWGPYDKSGPRGERMKSVTAVLSDADTGEVVGLLCINLDISVLDGALQLLTNFVRPRQGRPESLFQADWREAMQTVLQAWLHSAGASITALTREERISLVAEFDAHGLLEARGSADHGALLLGVARTSFYNYLREARTASVEAGHTA